jgi:hypothetical protein
MWSWIWHATDFYEHEEGNDMTLDYENTLPSYNDEISLHSIYIYNFNIPISSKKERTPFLQLKWNVDGQKKLLIILWTQHIKITIWLPNSLSEFSIVCHILLSYYAFLFEASSSIQHLFFCQIQLWIFEKFSYLLNRKDYPQL